MERFITRDPTTLEALAVLDRVADTDASVLITGESGTGKELLARGIHDASSRRKHAWVPMNCGAVPVGLHESELFGHVAGAFTDARRERPGRFEIANGGTIFLDEVGDMPKPVQTGLLRILQSGEYSPVGGSAMRNCDVRVVSATNRNLPALVTAGTFRQDLFYRLNIIAIEVPPLRRRRCDIPPLANHFLSVYGTRYRRSVSMGSSFVDALMQRSLPGNVRELENAVRRGVLVCRSNRLEACDLAPVTPESAVADEPNAPARTFHAEKARVIEAFERDYLTRALRKCGGIVSRAANSCGLSERNFHAKLLQYGISGTGFRGGSPEP